MFQVHSALARDFGKQVAHVSFCLFGRDAQRLDTPALGAGQDAGFVGEGAVGLGAACVES